MSTLWMGPIAFTFYSSVAPVLRVEATPCGWDPLRVLSLCSRCDHTVRGYPLPTPHRQGAGISDSATRPSAVFEDEVVLEEFELTPRACPARPALQTPPPVQPPSRAQPMADPARSRPSPLSLPHAAARSAQDPDTPPPPGLHAPSPLTAADNAATTAAAGSSRA